MKVTVKDKISVKPFPKLMIDTYNTEEDGTIVLFTNEGFGTVIRAVPYKNALGHYRDNWPMSHFQDFDGEITLSNE